MALLGGGHCNWGDGLYSESPWIRYSTGDDVMALLATRKEISYSREYLEMTRYSYGGAIEIQAGLLRIGLQRDFNVNATRLYRKHLGFTYGLIRNSI